MLYIPSEKSADGSAKVVYQSKDVKTEQTFDAPAWLARLVVHIPNKYEQLAGYVGAYSNQYELVYDYSDFQAPKYDYWD